MTLLHTIIVAVGALISSGLLRHGTTTTNAFLVSTTTTTTTSTTTSTSPYSFVSSASIRRSRRRSNECRFLDPFRPLSSSSLDNTIDNIDIQNDDIIKADDDDDDDDDDGTVVVTWLDEENTKSGDTTTIVAPPSTTTSTTTTTWGSKLSPKVKQRIIFAGQQRAIANKQKRISDMDRKRRECFVCLCVHLVCRKVVLPVV